MLTKLQNIQIISINEIQNQNIANANEQQKSNTVNQNHIINEQFKEFAQQLMQNMKNVKAIKYRLEKLRRKCMTAFKNHIRLNERQRILKCYFVMWKEEYLMKKIQNRIVKRNVFVKLKKFMQSKMKQNMNKVMKMTAQNCYQKVLKLKIFVQWKQTIKIQKKVNQLEIYLKKNSFDIIKAKCDIRKNDRFAKQLANSIYKQKLYKKYFHELNECTKICKIQNKIFIKQSKQFLKKLKKFYINEKLTYQNYYHKKLILNSFLKLKQNRQIEKYNRIYYKNLLKIHFNVWIKAGNILFYEKQQEMKNQEIVNQYLKRKEKIKLLYYFQKWKTETDQKIQNKKKNQIAKQYGQVKQKQYLLRKYFQAWQSLKLFNKAQQFYKNSLKSKIIIALKKSLIKSAQKWDNLYKFVENRQKRKYFNAIKHFISKDLTIILNFQTKKAWNILTFAITKNYVINTTKAQRFHQQNLKFKIFYGFKDIIQLKNKINKTIIFINANMILKRWHKGYKIRQFVLERKFVMMGKIFRQIKLLRMNKLWSEPNIRNSKKQQTQRKLGIFSQKNNTITQSSISFEKIYMESPERLFNLDYSVSAYNSNNNENF